MGNEKKKKWAKEKGGGEEWRIQAIRIGAVVFVLAIIVRLFILQVVDHKFYQALASGQHEIFKELFPSRGDIFVQDLKDGSSMPIATNQQLAFIYADPRHVEDAEETAGKIGEIFEMSEEEMVELQLRLSDNEDPYEPIRRHVPDELLEKVIEAEQAGVFYVREESRIYPEPLLGGHLIGFVGSNEDGTLSGKYGIEGFFDEELTGEVGFLHSERDIAGRLITVGEHSLEPAQDGVDLYLTIDRTIQYQVCDLLRQSVDRHQADGGSVIVMEPSTGKILAMCGAPDFDPNIYGEVESIGVFNNPVTFGAYESGSVFKPITMAAAIDTGAVEPKTEYEDTGEVEIDIYTIRNSDEKAHGIQNMTQVLEKSLNTGVIFAMRETGMDTFTKYVKAFGFGKRYELELDTEMAGDISSLDINHEIYAATASYGQGITVTPLQLAAAYCAIANGGILYDPLLVSEIHQADGTVEQRKPEQLRRVITEKTARLIQAMLVSVVKNGHASKAGVEGYYLAGKTGTAQVAGPGGEYLEDQTIATFAGFGPVEDPRFVVVTRIDHPRDVPWAADTAAPLFAEIADFLLKYFEIPPSGG